MIYTSAIYADAGHTQVTGTDEFGNTETRSIDNPHEFRREDECITGFLAGGGVIGVYVAPTPAVAIPQPALFAIVSVCIADGAISAIEQAAQFGTMAYDDGWLMASFADFGDSADYMISVQTDIPARTEQFKSDGFFELVFSDPVSGDPINPNRIDMQMFKVVR